MDVCTLRVFSHDAAEPGDLYLDLLENVMADAQPDRGARRDSSGTKEHHAEEAMDAPVLRHLVSGFRNRFGRRGPHPMKIAAGGEAANVGPAEGSPKRWRRPAPCKRWRSPAARGDTGKRSAQDPRALSAEGPRQSSAPGQVRQRRLSGVRADS